MSSVATSLGIDIPQLVQCLSNVIRTPGSSHLSTHLFLVCNTLFLFLSPLHFVTKMITLSPKWLIIIDRRKRQRKGKSPSTSKTFFFLLLIPEGMLSRDFFLYCIGQCATWLYLQAWKTEKWVVFFKLDHCHLWYKQNHYCIDEVEAGIEIV